jgi:hypothetical protein
MEKKMRKIIVQVCLIMTIIFSQSAKAEGLSEPIVGFYCTPTDVTVMFNSRLHIKCTSRLSLGWNEDIHIYYFSVSANDYDDLDRALQMATTAITTGKRLRLQVRNSSSYNPSGCSSSNCRKLVGISLLR